MDNKHVSVWGRTLEEYTKMFALNNISASIKIVSIADSPSTFNLQLRQLGTQITSIDPIYNLSVQQLKDVFQKSYLFNKVLSIKSREYFSFKNE